MNTAGMPLKYAASLQLNDGSRSYITIQLTHLQNLIGKCHPNNNYNLPTSSLVVVVVMFADHHWWRPSLLQAAKTHSRSARNLQHEKSFTCFRARWPLHYSRKVCVQFCTCVTSPQIWNSSGATGESFGGFSLGHTETRTCPIEIFKVPNRQGDNI